MKLEDIKIGGVYDVRVKVIKKPSSPITGQMEIGTYTVDRVTQLPMEYETLWFHPEEAPAFAEINSETTEKNSEPAPKYDPCRLFKKGDRVRVVEYKGRIKPYLKDLVGKVYTLDDGEDYKQIAGIKADDIDLIDVCHLELVTPVEELEPYFVMELKGAYGVYNTRFQPETEACHFFTDMHPAAKEAAEAECARLNAEHRKEQK